MGKGARRWKNEMAENLDAEIRLKAFAKLDELILVHGTSVPWNAIAQGFQFGSETILLPRRLKESLNRGK